MTSKIKRIKDREERDRIDKKNLLKDKYG